MKISSEQEMLIFGKKFAKKIKIPMVIELIGDIGAGKTTFVRGLAEGLNAKNQVTSPSFTISKSYALPNNKQLIHYDFYRLADPGLMSEDLAESLNSQNALVVIEWSDSVKNLLPENHTIIEITKTQDNSRSVNIKNSQNIILRETPKKTPIEQPSANNKNKSPITAAVSKSSRKDTVQLFLDTSTPETILRINDNEYRYVFANNLAEKLLNFIKDKLDENNKTWHDITKIEFMSGPGSFTGLRIGASIVNTLAHELKIPLYDHNHQKHDIIIPNYGRPANISKPVK